ncbi:unnamed protein product, partial [Mesorhabditis spiculigera]
MTYSIPPVLAAELPPIKEVVSFGDSLTDAGTYWFRFTTNPGLTWAQHVALHYGQDPLPNEHVEEYSQVYKGVAGKYGPGGLNYAQGGARANNAYSQLSQDPEGVPVSAKVQVEHFLAQHQSFLPDQLVTLYIGTNDVAYNYDPANDPLLAKLLRDNETPTPDVMAKEKARIEQAAQDSADITREILARGAKRVLVFQLLDMGNLPWFRSKASQVFMSAMSREFNEQLLKSLPKDPGILLIDTQKFVDELVAQGPAIGITHGAHEDACREVDQDYCYPNALKTHNADQTYIYAAGEHMTTRANALLAEYVLKQVAMSSLK